MAKTLEQLAEEVGFSSYGEDSGTYTMPAKAFHSRIEQFAKLYMQQELDKLEAVGWSCHGHINTYHKVKHNTKVYDLSSLKETK